MAQLLETPQLPEHDGVPEMKIGRRRIHAELHAQRTPGAQPLREPLAQLALAVELDRALAHHRELPLHLALDRSVRHVAGLRDPMQAALRHDGVHPAIRARRAARRRRSWIA